MLEFRSTKCHHRAFLPVLWGTGKEPISALPIHPVSIDVTLMEISTDDVFSSICRTCLLHVTMFSSNSFSFPIISYVIAKQLIRIWNHCVEKISLQRYKPSLTHTLFSLLPQVQLSFIFFSLRNYFHYCIIHFQNIILIFLISVQNF